MTTFVLSDETTNSYGFRVATAKLNLDRFKANPVMLYNHKELVGRWDNLRVESNQLLGDASFMNNEEEQLALKVSARVDKGFVRGASIGMHILSSRRDEKGVATVEAEVFECSVCDVPSNPKAVRLYDSQGEALSGEAFELTLNNITIKNKSKMEINKESYQALGLEPGAGVVALNQAIIQVSETCLSLQQALNETTAEKINSLIATALNEGRFLADTKGEFEKLAALDFSLAKQMIAALPKKKVLKTQSSTESSGEDKETWTFTDWRQKDPEGLLGIKKDDKERYLAISGC